ncbi:uncharacterized protein LOC143236116 [Tachypleus tridentatus]|uniref:uncharacterized protein LOC143236116 n=1 Tax=Tachypleus tridentatus TaxID=6853 RepID=UPI003FD525DC
MELDQQPIKITVMSPYSLPDEVKKIAGMQNELDTQISKLEVVLENKKVKCGKIAKFQVISQENIDEKYEEISSYDRKFSIVEDDVIIWIKKNKEILKEVQDLVSEVERARSDTEQKRISWEAEKKKFARARETMERHKDKVQKIGGQSEMFIRLFKCHSAVQDLHKEREEFMSNPENADTLRTNEALLGKQRDDLQKEKTSVVKETEELEHNILEVHKRIEQTEKELVVLRKRNSAQLLRLKRQVQEMQTRNCQWNERASQLEESIYQLRSQLQH